MFYTGFDVMRRFPHLIVASALLAKHDEEGLPPPRRVCYVLHPLPCSKHETEWKSAFLHPVSPSKWPLLPTTALRLAFQATEGSSTSITSLPRLKRKLEASSAIHCPASCILSNGGFIHTSLSLETPLLPTTTLQLTFWATEGSFTSITPLLRSKRELEASSAIHRPASCVLSNGGFVHTPLSLFCQQPPSDLRFEQWRARSCPSPHLPHSKHESELFCHLQGCNTSLARKHKTESLPGPTPTPPSRISSEGALQPPTTSPPSRFSSKGGFFWFSCYIIVYLNYYTALVDYIIVHSSRFYVMKDQSGPVADRFGPVWIQTGCTIISPGPVF